MDLSVNVAGIRMQNPVMPASGCFGCGEEYLDFIDPSSLGAIVMKGVTLLPRAGNEQPRLAEVFGGIINFIGLQNPGVEAIVRDKIPIARRFNVPVIVNISGNTAEEYEQMAQRLDGVEGVTALEVNISCPNIKHGGVAFGQDPEIAFSITQSVRGKTSLPVIVKLTPNVTDIVSIAKAVASAGANAVSLINTLKARARIKNYPSKGKWKWVEGGLSGPCIKPIALRMVSDLTKAKLGIPIIGMGGISNFDDALDFFESGADAIAIGTAVFVNPNVFKEVIEGLKKYLAENGFASFEEWKQKTRKTH